MRIAKAAGTFVGMLFILLFVIAVGSKGALKGPDAFALRWTMISVAVVVSALVTWLRWRTHIAGPRISYAAAAVEPAAHNSTPDLARRLDRLSSRGRAEDMTVSPVPPAIPPARSAAPPPPPPARDDSGAILAAGRQAIVFRQHFPPHQGGETLSFFGGAPIAPAGFRWPRPAGTADAKPFSFLMQIDCSSVPAPARLGLLPDRGVLYFFLDLTWGQTDAFRVIYEDADEGEYAVVDPPADLGPAFGDQAAYVWKWTQSPEDCPKLLPKWPFQPVAIDIPADARQPQDEEDEDAPLLWPGDKRMEQALRKAQGEDVDCTWFSVPDFIDPDGAMRRPFPNYPQDWRAVQICSGLVLERVRQRGSPTSAESGAAPDPMAGRHLPSIAALRHLSREELGELVVRTEQEARRWFEQASSEEAFAAVPQPDADLFWSWLEDKAWLIRFVLTEALTLSVEASVGHSPEAAARIGPDVAARVHTRHALASISETGLFVTTPDRMLAPPVDVQGNQWDRAKTHLLLLELSWNEGLGHHFGEGVYQFWITPEDLEARRFDRVELTADAY